MTEQGNKSTLVRHIRTFADDVRRAQAPTSEPQSQLPKVAVAKDNGVFLGNPTTVSPPTPQSTVRKEPVGMHPVLVMPAPARQTLRTIPLSIVMPPLPYPHPTDQHTPFEIRAEAHGMAPEGTIITETKKKQWSLGKALNESFTAWVAEQKDSLTNPAQATKQTLPPPETRAHTIGAARKQSAIAPQDDRHAVVEKLRTFARDVAQATKTSSSVARLATPSAPQWASTLDDPQHQVRTDQMGIKQARAAYPPVSVATHEPSHPSKILIRDVAPTATHTHPKKTYTPLQPEPTRAPAQHPSAPLVMRRPATTLPYGVSDIAPVVTPQPISAVPTEPLQPTPEEGSGMAARRHDAIERLLTMHAPPIDETPPVVTPSRDHAFTPPQFVLKKATPVHTYRSDALEDVAEHQRSITEIIAAEAIRRAEKKQDIVRSTPSSVSARPFVIAGIIMVTIIAVTGLGFFWYAKTHPQTNDEAVHIATFIAIDSQVPAPFATNHATLLETLKTSVGSTRTGITQIYLSGTDSATMKSAVATSDFFSALNPRAPGSFIRNLSEEMMFGAYNGTSPFFIFKTAQFTTAFAGMLEWEPFISTDLTPLFGEPLTSATPYGAKFVDTTLQNVDVRILYDQEGKERILYAFLNKTTLILTTSSDALLELITRLQQQ